jgi:hypothetical protein
MTQQLIEIPSFFKNPVQHFEAKRIRRLQEASITENEFFEKQLALFYNAHGPVLFFGYDSPFMDREDTRYEIAEHIKRSTEQPFVKCIFPESTPAESLEELARENNGIKIMRTPEDISKGYTVFGILGVVTWDSNKLTYHPEESANGVIYRHMYLLETKQFPKHFAKMEKQIQSRLH